MMVNKIVSDDFFVFLHEVSMGLIVLVVCFTVLRVIGLGFCKYIRGSRAWISVYGQIPFGIATAIIVVMSGRRIDEDALNLFYSIGILLSLFSVAFICLITYLAEAAHDLERAAKWISCLLLMFSIFGVLFDYRVVPLVCPLVAGLIVSCVFYIHKLSFKVSSGKR